jgi:uncharacterized integral membrane protein
MNAFLKFLVTLSFAVLLLWVAFSNRGAVPLTFSPVHDPLEISFSLIVLVSVSLGFVWGGLIVWLNGGDVRRDLRRRKKELARLEKDIEQMRMSSRDPIQDVKTLLPHPYI